MEIKLLPLLAAYDEAGRWIPGIGDDSPIAWVIVGAYALTTLLCLYRMIRVMRRDARGKVRLAVFWFVMIAFMGFLTVNKQLDLQSWFTQEAREWAKATGQYDDRAELKQNFYWMLGMASAAFVLVLALGLIGHLRNTIIPIFGLTTLLGFIMIRATSFNWVERFLGQDYGPVAMNHILELSGITIVLVGSLIPPRLKPHPTQPVNAKNSGTGVGAAARMQQPQPAETPTDIPKNIPPELQAKLRKMAAEKNARKKSQQ